MTREEFEQGYAERSGTTVAMLASLGRVARPCTCGEAGCEGWQMAHERGKRWYYLSFADDGGFRGGACIAADDDIEAVRESWRQGLNPGGDVRIVGPLPLGKGFRPEDCGRRLSADEAFGLEVIDL